MTTEIGAAANAADGTPLARVRGLGSAREGAEHWWHERLSSVALLLLCVWLAVSLLRLPALDHRGVTEWLKDPRAAVPMLLLVAASFWHLHMGLKVIVEDYVHDEGNRFLCVLLLAFAAVLGAAFGLFAVLRIAL
ncbi:MAG TPA: succinate dehydrogenase, hydrophobic membrane anchor protein [Allosphingosinicella sp.]|nr:succinate dehydrogenase, hydrophobic membrane anchor protein [Allosphingosinicella sp.]